MFPFDLLKSDDRRMQTVSYLIGFGLFVLLAGLWFVQVVYAKHFEDNARQQSLKRIGIPAVRGRVLDRNGRGLAESLAQYNAILYLEELQGQFNDAYTQLRHSYGQQHPNLVQSSGKVKLSVAERHNLMVQADCQVVSNITYWVSDVLKEPRLLNTNAFLRHYTNHPYVPFEIVPNLTRKQVARFAEQLSGSPELEVETLPVRSYTNGTLAAHLLGFVQRESLDEGEFSYSLPDYVGRSGVERLYDDDLRGESGVKLVLVNSMNYRQNETTETSNSAGSDIYLTIDLDVQRAAEQALASAPGAGPKVRGAAVVLDVRNGDVIAMASAPTFSPSNYVAGLSKAEAEELLDPKYTPQLNRAINGAYAPGSTFKAVTAIACLENGLDPEEEFDSPGYYQATPTSHRIADTAVAGKYNFARAFFRSSNTYFIHYGSMAGLGRILGVAHRFHLGEKTHFAITPEVAGLVPRPDQIGTVMQYSSTADVCIGQEVTLTPLQMAGFYAGLANGGKMYWPRIVSKMYSPETGKTTQLFAPGQLRDVALINPKHLEILRNAMLDDTEHPATEDTREGTAYPAFHHGSTPKLGDFPVCGKTGTAEVKTSTTKFPKITWFSSFGPYRTNSSDPNGTPRYAVIVMVEGGASGGISCAPVGEKIYEALIAMERRNQATTFVRN